MDWKFRLQAGPANPPTLLVVDDESSIRQLVSTVFEREGFQVLTADCEEEAVRVAKTHRDVLDIVLMDIRLGEGSGPGAAARIRMLQSDISVVFMSGFPMEDCLREGSIRENDHFLPKPFDLALLRRTVLLRLPIGSDCVSSVQRGAH